jgi:YD repeat-containing protein
MFLQLLSTVLAALIVLGALPAFAQAVTYIYDSAGHVTAANYGSAGSIAYAYDKAGNLISRTFSAPAPQLTVASMHSGNFAQGQSAATYTVTVANTGNAATINAITVTNTLVEVVFVTVTETVPAGLTLVSMGGTGWNCSSNTCSRSDILNAGASYPAITVTVNVGADASSPQVNSVSVAGGGSASASATDSTVVQATPPSVSVTPSSGSGLQQTFALQYADSLGATDLTSVWVWFSSNFNTASAPNSCMLYYARATNQLYFLNDAGTTWSSPVAPGAAVTLSNSQCSINVAAASVTVSGTNLTLSLPVTFTAAYAGAKNTYMYAAGSSANSGWQLMGSWTVLATSEVVSDVSVAPNSGSGFQQTFALQYADSLGATDLESLWVWFTSSYNAVSAANSCMLYYARATNQLFFLNDAGTTWSSPVAPGAAVTLSNSQCSINVVAASVTVSGTNLTLNLPVTFMAAYAGAKNTYIYAAGSSANSGWQLMGSWTVPSTVAVVSDVSVAPNSGTGLQQTFALQYADSLGATDLASQWVWFTSNYNAVSASNSCMLYYARATNQLFFLNDAGTTWSSPVAPGAAVTLSNSQCSINVAAASVTVLGTNLTLNLPVTFTAAYAGAKNTYMYAAGSSANSGWQLMGSWTVPSTVAVVSVVSVTPNSGTGLQQTFALQYADSLGATDLASVWVWFTSNYNAVSAPNSCMLYYARATNQLFFLNDAGTTWSSPVAPGTAVTLSNSQCSINVAAASVTVSGMNLTLNLPVTFTAAYAGAKNTYMYAAGSSANSGWQLMGSWTVPSTVAVVSDVSVAPNSGTGVQQTFALQYADSLGATDLASVWVWFTANYNTASAPNSCMLYYARATNQLFFLNDAGTTWSSPVAPGAAMTLSNSQCSINVAAANVTVSGTNLTLNLPVTFAAAYAGAKNTYMYAAGSSADSGWQLMGIWTVPSTVAVVSDVSVTPNSGTGLQQTFALQYADSLGAADMASVWVWFTSNYNTVSAPNSCMVYYARATNQLYFLNDAGTTWSSPVAPGAAVTLSNSQCSINVASASVTVSGTNLTLNLPVTFTAAYAGAKGTYIYAAGSSAISGWQALGSWTP